LGVGFEYGFTPNWSVGLEYDHLFMGSSDYSFAVVDPLFAGAHIRQDVDMATVRVNYRFDWGAPLLAKY
jgi:outer membrane immunogenic protein